MATFLGVLNIVNKDELIPLLYTHTVMYIPILTSLPSAVHKLIHTYTHRAIH